MATELKDIKLYYFTQVKGSKTIGRGDYIRLMLEDASVDYEYVRLTWDQWKEKKVELLEQGEIDPTMPYITIGGKHYFKTLPAMRVIAKKLGKYNGENEEEEYLLDAYSDSMNDWMTKWGTALFVGNEETLKTYKETHRVNAHKMLNRMFSLNKGPYVLGEKITYIDFFIYHILDDDTKTIVDIEAEAHVDAETYPHVATFIEAFKNRPNLKGSIALQ
ncbi:hypothetical protein G6F65_005311 [Rhizopus arrhizus]|uniref:GST C-terminal domain-containing protein n=1 Tax=Rhizopus oryzae TaxID=64495 RepID=A0A9P6XAM8_RHIOR|nr:hypothetical protein G6F23_009330 [Rhizopus arrhizus]KAG1281982.1 hypothetical protein G6F65_005311 [Rhizopus arrhizus]KAG1309175.1 hypothetical protein G6F64_005505 [Rhizopus arrhizus]